MSADGVTWPVRMRLGGPEQEHRCNRRSTRADVGGRRALDECARLIWVRLATPVITRRSRSDNLWKPVARSCLLIHAGALAAQAGWASGVGRPEPGWKSKWPRCWISPPPISWVSSLPDSIFSDPWPWRPPALARSSVMLVRYRREARKLPSRQRKAPEAAGGRRPFPTRPRIISRLAPSRTSRTAVVGRFRGLPLRL